MKEIYWLVFVYDFIPEIQIKLGKHTLKLKHPDGKYFTEYTLDDKITYTRGVDPWRIFKKKKGYPPR